MAKFCPRDMCKDFMATFRCFHDGKCQDGVDSYTCSCDESFSGTSCECSGEDSCINVNESRSWEPPENFDELVSNPLVSEFEQQMIPSMLDQIRNTECEGRSVN